MKVSELLAERQPNWAELQRLCNSLEKRGRRKLTAAAIARFAALYRSACADLALADAYHLPPNTVQYLHQLVARAHNQLYRSRRFRVGAWWRELVYHVPARLFNDKFFWVSFFLFFGFFVLSYAAAYNSPQFAKAALGEDTMKRLRMMYETPVSGRSVEQDSTAAGGYVYNNAGIGLQCFALGLLAGGFGGLFVMVFNACFLGAAFGYMDTTPMSGNFTEFVTAHAPFELTAIVLAGAAGMRLGFSYIYTKGLTRGASLRQAGRHTLPAIMAAIIMFVLAAGIEGYISPSALPYSFKALVAVVSGLLLVFYFVLLGMPNFVPRPAEGDGSWDAAVRE